MAEELQQKFINPFIKINMQTIPINHRDKFSPLPNKEYEEVFESEEVAKQKQNI